MFEVTSGWSEVGPHWNNLSIASGGNGWAGGAPSIDTSGSAQGRWVVTAKAVNFTLSRVIQIDPPPPKARTDKHVSARRLLINDTVTNTAPATIGMAIRHSAALVKGGTVGGREKEIGGSGGSLGPALGLYASSYAPPRIPFIWRILSAFRPA